MIPGFLEVADGKFRLALAGGMPIMANSLFNE